MKAYKGFNKDMTCRGFQYAEGETYETDEAKLCESGFHACEAPIDCLAYYNPSDSVYHEVELEDVSPERSRDDTKVAAKKIKVGARLSIKNLVDAQIEYVREHCPVKENDSTGHRAVNSSTGGMAVNSSTGYMAANSSTGYMAANSSTGYMAANSSTGDMAVNSSTGDRAVNSSTGGMAVNSSTGGMAVNSSTGDRAVNSSTGDMAVNSAGCGGISVGWGKENRCRGAVGSYMVLCERGDWNGKTYPLLCEPVLVKVDGDTIKADTWYTMENGKIVEANDDD